MKIRSHTGKLIIPPVCSDAQTTAFNGSSGWGYYSEAKICAQGFCSTAFDAPKSQEDGRVNSVLTRAIGPSRPPKFPVSAPQTAAPLKRALKPPKLMGPIAGT